MIKARQSLRNFRKGVAIAICLAGVTVFSGCDKGGENDPTNNGAITVADNSSLTQEVFADNTEGKSNVSFTTTGAWTSELKSQVSLKSTLRATASSNESWLDWSPKSGDKAGNYNLAIILEPNLTGADRTNEIEITCDGKKITISVTQKGVKEDGQKLVFNPIGTWWCSRVEGMEDGKAFGYTFTSASTSEYKRRFNSDGTLDFIEKDNVKGTVRWDGYDFSKGTLSVGNTLFVITSLTSFYEQNTYEWGYEINYFIKEVQ